jgi:hypothetical protein
VADYDGQPDWIDARVVVLDPDRAHFEATIEGAQDLLGKHIAALRGND